MLKPDSLQSASCGHPTLDMTGNLMIFASDIPGGYGGKDLWITVKEKEELTEEKKEELREFYNDKIERLDYAKEFYTKKLESLN